MTNITEPGRGSGGNDLDADSVNELLIGVLRLTAEVSAMRERVSIWERVLEAKGLPVNEDDTATVTASLDPHLHEADCDQALPGAAVTLDAPAVAPDVPYSGHADATAPMHTGMGLLTRLARLLRHSR